MAATKKIEVTEELIALNPELLKEAKVGDKIEAPEGLVLPEKKPKKETDEEVTIPKKTLDAILSSLEDLKARDTKRDAEIAILRGAADKARLNKLENNQDGNLIRTAKIGMWEGLPVIGWANVKDEVGFRDGRLQVTQKVMIFLDEGKEKPKEVEVDYLFWAQNTTTQSGEVIETLSRGGRDYWTIELKDGKKLTLDTRFVNPF